MVYSPLKRSFVLPVSPFLCLAIIRSAIPRTILFFSISSGVAVISGRLIKMTISASCSIAPDSLRSESWGSPTIRLSCESAITGTSSSLAIILRSPVMCAISRVRFSSWREPLDISCM